MAITNPFHRRSSGAVLDRDHDGVDDRDERAAAGGESTTTRWRTRFLNRDRDRNDDGIDDRAQPPVAPTVTAPPEPTAPPETAPPETIVRTSRTSMLATLGLIVGTAATFASLTGRLAPVGIAVGVVGLIIALGGVLASSRRFVNGRGVAMLGVLASLAGIVFGILALNDTASWLDADVNQVDRLRAWLDAQIPDIEGW